VRTLRALRMRRRRAYQTRHTYITWAIMQGAEWNGWARQVGHISAAMIHSTYFFWVDKANQAGDREAAKLEEAAKRSRPLLDTSDPKAQ
jgi:integrase